MNKFIKQLEPQCWEMTEFGLRFNYEKYADLIIRECATAVANANNPLGRNIDKIFQMHFDKKVSTT
jgi:hypothetical protein